MPKAVQLPSGSWRCQVFDGRDADGKRIYKSFTAKKRKDAESAAALWIADSERRKEEEELARKRAAIPTLDQAMSSFIDTCRAQSYSPSTIAGYLKIQRTAFDGLIDKKIDEITAADVQLAIDSRAADHSPKTIKNDYAFIHSVLKRYRPELNLSGIILAKNRKKSKRVYSQAWAADILMYTRDNLRPDFYVYVLFIICAGCRPSEVHSLIWDDISSHPIIQIDGSERYKVGTIRIDSASVRGEDGAYHDKDPKTDAGNRIQTLDWSFFEELYRVRPRGNPDDRIVTMCPSNLSKEWAKVRIALDLPKTMRFYDLRHYFATTLSSAGASDEELAAAMGHTTAAMTHDVYIEMFEEDRRRVSRTMAASTARLFDDLSGSQKKSAEAAK